MAVGFIKKKKKMTLDLFPSIEMMKDDNKYNGNLTSFKQVNFRGYQNSSSTKKYLQRLFKWNLLFH